MKYQIQLLIITLSLPFSLPAQQAGILEETLEKHTVLSFPMFKELLSIPNDASYPADIEKNVQWCEQSFQARNFETRRIPTATVPLLWAAIRHKNAKKTVLIYLHMDGQPVDHTHWQQENPYKPVLKTMNAAGNWIEIPWERIAEYEDEWRIFARAASDAKGPVAMFFTALDIIDELNIIPNYNIKVIVDFEEELGSPHLPKAVMQNAALLHADMLVIFDGPRHISNKPTLSFGARGIATIQLTTYGPIVPQHSGHFGNYVPNPAIRLCKLLAAMKDDEGRVTIPGFYEGIEISHKIAKILKNVPDDETQIKKRLQIASSDRVGSYYQESLQYPSLNIRGLQSGWINEKVRTIIPSWARAEIDVRLVVESKPEKLIELIKNHINNQGYYVIDHMPTKEERLAYDKIATFTAKISYQSFRTKMDTEVGIWLRKALFKAFGTEPILIRMSGGSIPISPFVNTLNIPAVTVPTVNRDNNQHSPNENLRLGNYREGIKTMVAILSEKL